MKNSDTELVLVTEKLDGSEVDILVKSADDRSRQFEEFGGKIIVPPFEIAIGRCSVVQDPWNNCFFNLRHEQGSA